MSLRGVSTIAICLAALPLLSTPAAAQVYTGRIDVQVRDTLGAVLPGATVTLAGPMAGEALADQMGEAHFLNLPVGDYRVAVRLDGFGPYASAALAVEAGSSVPVRAVLDVAGVSEQVTVTAETPLVDARRQTTGATLTQGELQGVPMTREWSSATQSVPAVITDRVNVGGSETGGQSNIFAKGASNAENIATIDGVVLTDAATNTAMALPDFDLFQEIQVTTGGASISNPTSGTQVNLVLKSGADTPHGSASFYFEDDSLQGHNLTPDLQAQIGTTEGNHVDRYREFAMEVGGPLVRDRLWAWGAAALLDMSMTTLGGYADPTRVSTFALKTTWQAGASIRPSFTYYRGRFDKPEYGVGPLLPPDVAMTISVPNDLVKAGTTIVVGRNLFVAVQVSHMAVRQDFTPASCLDSDIWRDTGGVWHFWPTSGCPARDIYRDPGGVWHGGSFYGRSSRPQTTVAADGSFFRGRHELKFGFSWRRTPIDSISGVGSANKMFTIDQPDYANSRQMLAYAYRDIPSSTDARYLGFYLGDTARYGRATLTAALRWDRAAASVLETSAAGVPGLEQFLPAVTAPAVRDALVYSVPSPRVGASYQLDREAKTQVRASYALLPSLLKTRDARMASGIVQAEVYYLAFDQNNDRIAQWNEIQFGLGPLGMFGFDPRHPADVSTSVNRIDPKLRAPVAHEVVVGFDRQWTASLSTSVSYTYRRFVNQVWKPLIGVQTSDYLYDSTLTGELFGTPYSIDNLTLPNNSLPPGVGRELVNREGYHQVYQGLEISVVKRLDRRWMARLGFSTNSHREYFDDPAASKQDPVPGPASPDIDGGQVVFATTKSQGTSTVTYVVQPRYQFVANGVYQAPWGLQASANLLVRQGYAIPYYLGNVLSAQPFDRFPPLRNVLVTTAVDQYRLPPVVELDLRLQKTIRVHDSSRAVVSLDLFNLLNRATVLARQPDRNLQGETGFDAVQEVMSPRVARLGLRFTF